MSTLTVGLNQNSSIMELFKQRREALKSMEAAVQSGDIGAAQKSLSSLQDATKSTDTKSDSTSPFRTMMKNDLSGLMSAVGSGDVGSAQTALQKLETDQRTARSSAPLDTKAPPPPASTSAASAAGGAGGASFLDSLKSLLTASLAGDTKGAQVAATALNADIEKVFGTVSANTTDGTDTTTKSSASASSGTSTTGGTQNSFLADLEALINSAQSGDKTAAQKAAQTFAGDLQNAIGSAGDAPPASGHHHHHHHAESAQSTASTDAASSTTTSNTATVGASDPDGDGDTHGSPVKSAKSAIDLLMSFANAVTGTTTPASTVKATA